LRSQGDCEDVEVDFWAPLASILPERYALCDHPTSDRLLSSACLWRYLKIVLTWFCVRRCPETGFYCPGRQEDRTNDPPASRPILIPQGMRVLKRWVVDINMSNGTSPTSFASSPAPPPDRDQEEWRTPRLFVEPCPPGATADLSAWQSYSARLALFCFV
jgi:hypothetical protein